MTPEEKNHILDLIQDFVTDLIKDDDDILFYGGGGYSDFLNDAYNRFVENYHPEVEWIRNGVSKIVISFSNLPHCVIKIPFKGFYDDYSDTTAYFIEANCDQPFKNINDWDYCETEAKCYYDAKEYYNLGDMFAKTEYLGEIENTPIYISEKITTIMSNSCVKSSNEHTEKIAKSLREKYEVDYCFCEGSGLSAFIDCYGEERTEELVSFLEEYGIADLHDGNIGYDLYGNVKIIDYSGWND